jgi:hypothetical protein
MAQADLLRRAFAKLIQPGLARRFTETTAGSAVRFWRKLFRALRQEPSRPAFMERAGCLQDQRPSVKDYFQADGILRLHLEPTHLRKWN